VLKKEGGTALKKEKRRYSTFLPFLFIIEGKRKEGDE